MTAASFAPQRDETWTGLECGKCAYLSWVGLLKLAVAAYWKNRENPR